jgi:glycosyltransferase involved in cell wall biosynthesis
MATEGLLRVAVVMPVFNDWESFTQLCSKIDALSAAWGAVLTLIAVDDGSSEALNQAEALQRLAPHIVKVEVLTLVCNLGHQRAIVTGLSAVIRDDSFDAAVICDSDGEDRPEDIGRLIAAYREGPQSVIVARRSRRTEAVNFRAFYGLYKLMFRGFTGRNIDFGNFCLLSYSAMRWLLYMPESWNHLAASILRSRLKFRRLDCARGTRYAGRSSMNFVSLLAHGMSAVSVFNDLVFVRLLGLSAVITLFAIVVASIAIVIRLTTNAAIPGWATNVVGISVLMIFQGLLLSVIASVTMLANRSAPAFIPAIQAQQFIARRVTLVDRCRA